LGSEQIKQPIASDCFKTGPGTSALPAILEKCRHQRGRLNAKTLKPETQVYKREGG
jgi:hypothetical protein